MATNISVIGAAHTTKDFERQVSAWESDVLGGLIFAGDIELGDCKDELLTEEVTKTTGQSEELRSNP